MNNKLSIKEISTFIKISSKITLTKLQYNSKEILTEFHYLNPTHLNGLIEPLFIGGGER